MDTSRFEPSKAFRNLREEIDTLIDRFVERPLGVLTGQMVIPLDLIETDLEFIVKADVPGINEKELDITVQNDVLTLRGTRKEDRDVVGRTGLITERPLGNFARSVRLPVPVRADQVRASYRRGILEIVLPKREPSQGRKIEIKTDDDGSVSGQ